MDNTCNRVQYSKTSIMMFSQKDVAFTKSIHLLKGLANTYTTSYCGDKKVS